MNLFKLTMTCYDKDNNIVKKFFYRNKKNKKIEGEIPYDENNEFASEEKRYLENNEKYKDEQFKLIKNLYDSYNNFNSNPLSVAEDTCYIEVKLYDAKRFINDRNVMIETKKLLYSKKLYKENNA